MTQAELFEITKLVGIKLYEFGDATITSDDGRKATIPQREIMALASGISSASTLISLVPPKPVDELTIADITDVTHAIVAAHANMLEKTGLLFEDGDAND